MKLAQVTLMRSSNRGKLPAVQEVQNLRPLQQLCAQMPLQENRCRNQMTLCQMCESVLGCASSCAVLLHASLRSMQLRWCWGWPTENDAARNVVLHLEVMNCLKMLVKRSQDL